MSAPLLRVISLGAGVQSTTMALMAARGEIGPMPDCAIFADTGDEPQSIYDHLDWLETLLPFPVYRVRNGEQSLSEHVVETYRQKTVRTASPPFFTKNPSGMLPRQCTKEFKVRPITRKVRELIGIEPGKQGPRGVKLVEQWIGISTDEASRMKPAETAWIQHRWPLIEIRKSRFDCLAWMERNGFPRPSKSSCFHCPFHDEAQWRDLKTNHPADFAKAVQFDSDIRAGGRAMVGEVFLHRSLIPLGEVDFSSAEDRGQLNMFINECEGMCGV
jgi:hypothetical protein